MKLQTIFCIKTIILKFILVRLTLVCLFLPQAYAQVTTANNTVFVSSIDNLLTIKKISVLPVIDNVSGIYSRPIEEKIIQLVEKDHRWDYIKFNLAGPLLPPEELSGSPNKLQQITQGLESDAIISTRLTKGPNGISINMNMFLLEDGKLFSKVELKQSKNFDIGKVNDEVEKLFNKVIASIPYQGLVLSRLGNRVTTNLGKKDGIEPGQIVSVIQIIKANRHPKFNFIINTEKEVLGKIKLIKIDKTLSFGRIVVEKEKGVISKNAKISGLQSVSYGPADSFNDNDSTQDNLMKRPDALISFGKNATEWLPKKEPMFGAVGATLGNSFATFSRTVTSPASSAGSQSTKSIFNPYIGLNAELWLTPVWTMHARIEQGIVTLDNPLSGDTPAELNATTSLFEFLVGYKFRLSPTAWGPQFEVRAGMMNYDMSIDASTNNVYTSTKYSGLKLGLNGSYPVDKRQDYSLGANLDFLFSPGMDESPLSSGSGEDNSISSFGIFGAARLGINVKAQLNLDFELYKTTFSSPVFASSSSQKHTKLGLALYWLF